MRVETCTGDAADLSASVISGKDHQNGLHFSKIRKNWYTDFCMIFLRMTTFHYGVSKKFAAFEMSEFGRACMAHFLM